jgi:flagellar M-ring protein FliF
MDPSAVVGQVTAGYMRLPLLQKILFPLLIVGAVSGIVLVSRWASRPDYGVLFSDLDQSDAGTVIQKLKELKVKYEIRADGSQIAISPADMVPEIRMALATEGMPKGGTIGLELFDLSTLGATTFQEKIKLQRALQGELERTITSLDAVQSARVHITQPERSVFSKQSSPATASVMLRLNHGKEVVKAQIKGMANLVAGSVPGLTKENVTIVDVFGNLLYPLEEEEQGLAGEATRLAYQRDIERSYVQRIEQMLLKVLGPGRVVARVNADMDFSMNEREEESFDPGGQVLRSERTVDEGQGLSDRGGIPGVVSNLSNDPKLLAPKDSSDRKNGRSEQVRNFEVSRAVSRTSQPRGKLTRISAAVLVDGSPVTVAAAKEGEPSSPPAFKPLEQEMLSQIDTIVKTAIGFDASRGDTVSVENVPFFAPDNSLAEALDQKATQDLIFNSIYRAGPVLFILLFFVIVVRPLIRFLVTPTEAEVDLQRLLPTGIEELEKEMSAERGKRAEIPEVTSSVDMDQLAELMAENSRLVKENPSQAALLIRYWLNDGRM